MTKRVVDIDDDALADARAALGTSTITETVNRALAESSASVRRKSFVDRLSEHRLPELGDSVVRSQAWR